jgi:hypothetical protein
LILNALFAGSAPDSEWDAGYRRYKIRGRLRGGSDIGSAFFRAVSVAKSLSGRATSQRRRLAIVLGQQLPEIAYWQANSK